MDALSTSISVVTIPKSNLINHHHHHHLFSSSAKQKTTKLISNKTTCSSSSSSTALHPHVNGVQHYSPRPHHHLQQRPYTGYAVALLDAARRHNAVEAVHRDVKRLWKWVRDGRAFDMNMMVVKEVVKEGRFEKHVVKLVKLLAEKSSKLDLLMQVLSEFGKIYEQLSLTNEQLLLLPSGLKVEDSQILEIVGRIRSLTAADKVTICTS